MLRRLSQTFRGSISGKYIGAFLLCLILPLCLLCAFFFQRMQQILMDNERQNVSQKIDASIRQLDQYLQEMSDILNALGISNQMTEVFRSDAVPPSYPWYMEYKAFENLLHTVAARGSRQYKVTAISGGGKVYHSGALYNSFISLDSPAVRRVLESPEVFVLFNGHLEGMEDNEMITMGKAFREGETLLGVVLVDVPEEIFADVFDVWEQTYNHIFVFEKAGHLLYTNARGVPGAQGEGAELPAPGGAETLTLDGTEFLVIHGDAPNSRLSASVLVSKAHAFRDSNVLTLQLLLGFLVILLTTVGAVVLLSTRISRNIKRLNQEVSHFGKTGEVITLPPRSRDEVGQLTEGIAAMSRRIHRLLAQIREDEHTKWQLEFRVLQSQINPHMLYNTLNTITYLAQLQNVRNIEEVSSSFVHLLRMVSSRNDEFITFTEELECVTAYVAIKQYNLPWEIRCDIESDDALGDCRILKLLLQPFVENCIVHAFPGVRTDAHIEIHARLVDGEARVEILDNGEGMDEATIHRVLREPPSPRSFSNVGVYNTIRRLKLTYGDRARFSMKSVVGGGTRVELSFPAEPYAQEEEDV